MRGWWQTSKLPDWTLVGNWIWVFSTAKNKVLLFIANSESVACIGRRSWGCQLCRHNGQLIINPELQGSELVSPLNARIGALLEFSNNTNLFQTTTQRLMNYFHWLEESREFMAQVTYIDTLPPCFLWYLARIVMLFFIIINYMTIKNFVTLPLCN